MVATTANDRRFVQKNSILERIYEKKNTFIYRSDCILMRKLNYVCCRHSSLFNAYIYFIYWWKRSISFLHTDAPSSYLFLGLLIMSVEFSRFPYASLVHSAPNIRTCYFLFHFIFNGRSRSKPIMPGQNTIRTHARTNTHHFCIVTAFFVCQTHIRIFHTTML